MKRRTGDPWMPAARYSATLRGLTVNLAVADVARTVAFQSLVLEATIIYSDPDIAVFQVGEGEWMVHADHTYDAHPFAAEAVTGPRGRGIELRVHNCDPDGAAARAQAGGYRVIAQSADKGHGLREAYIEDPDGYVWVPDVPLASIT